MFTYLNTQGRSARLIEDKRKARESIHFLALTPTSPLSSVLKEERTSRLKVNLPKFDRDSLYWSSFWQHFNKVIEEDKCMVKPFKQASLNEAMQHPEAKTIAQNTENEEYEYMVNRLQQHYHQPKILFPTPLEGPQQPQLH